MTNKISDCSSPDKNMKSGNMESAKAQKQRKSGMEAGLSNAAGNRSGNRANAAECGNMEAGAVNRAASGAANSSSRASYQGVSGAESAESRRYKCKNCGTVLKGSKAPDKCPKCDGAEFAEE